MKIIYLIGFMGSGKSSVGKKLSDTFQLSFVDTDDYIEKKYREKISNIFKTKGEAVFRNYEEQVIKDLVEYDLVATGGGIVERENNGKVMRKQGTVLYLHASFSEIKNRLQHSISRPLWRKDNLKQTEELYKRRIPLYEKCAHYKIETDGKSIEAIVKEIGNVLALNG